MICFFMWKVKDSQLEVTKQSIVFSHAKKNQKVINFIHKGEEKTQISE